MFAYCQNKPSCAIDPSGQYAVLAPDLLIDEDPEPNFVPINNQLEPPYSSMSYGLGNVGDNGCTAIGTYNALGLAGYSAEFDAVSSYYVDHWYFLFWGTPSFLIGGCLSSFGADYSYSTDSQIIEKCKDGGAVIVNIYNKVQTISYCTVPGMGHEKSLWTTAVVPDYSAGKHTVAITYQNGCYNVYNLYGTGNAPASFSDYRDFLNGRRFINGYYVFQKG